MGPMFEVFFTVIFAAFSASGAVEIPDSENILRWSDPKYATSDLKPLEAPDKKVECADPNLYPTQPQQSLKLYHFFKFGYYDASKIPADHEICKVASRSTDPKKRFCIVADTIEHAIISDTYEDGCGQRYRGFTETAFLKKDETIASLVSVGHILDLDTSMPYQKNWIATGTYPVPSSSFIKLTELLPGDSEKIDLLQKEALESGFVRCRQGSFCLGPVRAQ